MSDLQFETSGQGQATCKSCTTPIQQTYFTQSGAVICPGCREKFSQPPRLHGFVAFLRACVFGGAGAALSALLSFLVSYLTGYELGIVWLFLGAGIGACVHIGSERRGGKGYSLLALFLTYIAIGGSLTLLVVTQELQGTATAESSTSSVRTFLPSLTKPEATPTPQVSPAANKTPAPEASPSSSASPLPNPTWAEQGTGTKVVIVLLYCVFALVGVFAFPIAVIFSSPISAVIYGLGLHSAWKACALKPDDISGPFQLAQS